MQMDTRSEIMSKMCNKQTKCKFVADSIQCKNNASVWGSYCIEHTCHCPYFCKQPVELLPDNTTTTLCSGHMKRKCIEKGCNNMRTHLYHCCEHGSQISVSE